MKVYELVRFCTCYLEHVVTSRPTVSFGKDVKGEERVEGCQLGVRVKKTRRKHDRHPIPLHSCQWPELTPLLESVPGYAILPVSLFIYWGYWGAVHALRLSENEINLITTRQKWRSLSDRGLLTGDGPRYVP